MDYEKKYKEEEVVRATQLWECGDITREQLEYIFPELKESEDERIRKAIIDTLNRVDQRIIETNYGIKHKDAVAWLEKQGPSAWSEEDEKILNSLIISLARIGASTRTDSTSINYTFSKEIDWLKSLKQRIGE